MSDSAERLLEALEQQARTEHVAYSKPIRVTAFANEMLYQHLGFSVDAVTRERAVELLAAEVAEWAKRHA